MTLQSLVLYQPLSALIGNAGGQLHFKNDKAEFHCPVAMQEDMVLPFIIVRYEEYPEDTVAAPILGEDDKEAGPRAKQLLDALLAKKGVKLVVPAEPVILQP